MRTDKTVMLTVIPYIVLLSAYMSMVLDVIPYGALISDCQTVTGAPCATP